MVIVDTTVWVDYFNDANNAQTRWLDGNAGRQEIGLIDLILCEILQGIKNEKEFVATGKRLSDFEVFASGGPEMAQQAAMNFRKLRKRGFTVRKTIACWIATFCLRNDHSLLHRDSDFDPFENELGLRVVKA